MLGEEAELLEVCHIFAGGEGYSEAAQHKVVSV